MIGTLIPMPVAGPLLIAGLLLAFGRLLPRRGPDVVAILTVLAAAATCVVLLLHATAHPLVLWFGGWTPKPGLVLGIAFAVDQPGGAMAVFICALFATTLLFAWGYFDEVHAHFHVLMLLFLAGMVGFCLTHDLFNLFVWFEVMSVAAFALTGYELRSSALEGALNFTIVNTIGSYCILGGIGLIYSVGGALDFSALGAAVARSPQQPVIGAAFVLIAAGLLVKGAQVPFQFWLADAHAVAPSPVSVIFSGAMVSIALFGLARLGWTIFIPSPVVVAVIRHLLLGLGAASAIVGGIMALTQRHLKRMLAFSTISHAGILLVGFSLLGQGSLAGLLVYLVGHGLVKASLFMVAGILLATRASIDELELRGLGGEVWPAGIAMGLGGLLLAGMPLGLMDRGFGLIGNDVWGARQAWVLVPVLVGSALTGAAVLRATGRIFLGWGEAIDEEEAQAPTEEEQEKADRPLWLMMTPVVVLLLPALVAMPQVAPFAMHAAAQMTHPETAAILGQPVSIPSVAAAVRPAQAPWWLSWSSLAAALLIAGYQLGHQRLPRPAVRALDLVGKAIAGPIETLHSGLVADYVTWLVMGLALFCATFALAP